MRYSALSAIVLAALLLVCAPAASAHKIVGHDGKIHACAPSAAAASARWPGR